MRQQLLKDGYLGTLELYSNAFTYDLVTEQEFLDNVRQAKSEMLEIIDQAKRRYKKPLTEVLLEGTDKIRNRLGVLEQLGLITSAEVEFRHYEIAINRTL